MVEDLRCLQLGLVQDHNRAEVQVLSTSDITYHVRKYPSMRRWRYLAGRSTRERITYKDTFEYI